MMHEELGPCVRETPTVQLIPAESVRTVVTDLLASFRRQAIVLDLQERIVSSYAMRHAASEVADAFAELLEGRE